MAAAILSGAAQAQDIEVSGSVVLVSDYVFRGVSYSNGKPALQGELVASHGGLYGVLFASTLSEFEDGQGGSSSTEIGAQIGWATDIEGMTVDLGVVGYDYPGASDVASYGLYLTASQPVGPVEAQLGAWVTPHQSSIRSLRTGETDDSLYLRARVRAPASGGWTTPLGSVSLTGSVGWHQGAGVINVTNATDEYGLDGALTLSVRRGAVLATVGLVATDFESIDGRGRNQAGTRGVASLAWVF
jgi:uncharacterized protein (TIGR02001 family)